MINEKGFAIFLDKTWQYGISLLFEYLVEPDYVVCKIILSKDNSNNGVHFGMFIMILYLVNETSLIWKMVFSNYEMGTHLTG